jgi:asparagine synthase (glutamine-hydrolysing)
MLAKLKAKNIICVTYSKPGTKILSVAKAIAGQAGFPWIFIPYNRKIWQDCIRSETTKHFVEIAHNIHTLPNLQDFPAVKYLSENNLIPTDSIFVPGHTAMMYLKGQPLRPGPGAVADAILAKHYCRWDWSLKYRQFHGLLYKKICSTMGNSFTAETLEEAILNFEKWELKERQPKFIVNAVRTYEYFGYEWRLPLWDKELVNFWLSIPLSARNGKKAIKKLLEQRGLEKSPSLQKKVSRRKNLRHYKEKIMQMPILFYLINKLDLRPSQVPRYWTNPLAFYGISSLKEYLFSYHYNLNAHSLLIKNLYENKYSAEFARSCTSFFTRNITNW